MWGAAAEAVPGSGSRTRRAGGLAGPGPSTVGVPQGRSDQARGAKPPAARGRRSKGRGSVSRRLDPEGARQGAIVAIISGPRRPPCSHPASQVREMWARRGDPNSAWFGVPGARLGLRRGRCEDRTMRMYRGPCGPRNRQVAPDVVVLLAVLLFAWFASAVKETVMTLTAISAGFTDSAQGVEDTWNSVGLASGMPFVGDDIPCAVTGSRTRRSATRSTRRRRSLTRSRHRATSWRW